MPGVIAQEGNLILVDFGGPGAALTKKQLAAALGMSVRWVEARMKEGMEPAFTDRRGRRMFSLRECETWLNERSAANG
jgi:hypothetical protein